MGLFLLLALLICCVSTSHAYTDRCIGGQHEYEAHVRVHADAHNDGIREFVCIYCGDSYTQVIPKTGHVYGEYQTEIEASCLSQGRQYRVCAVCGKREYQIIPFETEHTFGSWSILKQPVCNAPGIRTRKCEICGYTEEQEIAATQNHEYEEVVTQPTSTEAGEIALVCIHCGDKVIVEILEPLGVESKEEEIPVDLEETVVEVVEVEEKGITPLEVAVAGMNVLTFGVYFMIIGSDLALLKWAKGQRKKMYERGEWR